jgi:hypothetical protein
MACFLKYRYEHIPESRNPHGLFLSRREISCTDIIIDYGGIRK